MSIHLSILKENLEPSKFFEQQAITPNIGAQSIFIGYMRDFRDDNPVDAMFLEYYPKMTEQQIKKIAKNIINQYQIIDLVIAHRVGRVIPTDPIVYIAATASHRTNAITACKEMLEQLKHNAPFWKKEQYQNKETWVLSNTANNIHHK